MASDTLPRFHALGTRVHPVPLETALAAMDGWVQRREPGRFVVASGMHAVLEGYRDESVRAIVNQADLFVLDGFSLVWLARRRGFPMPARVCGVDLMRAFCALGARRGYRMFFYGDTPQVLADLADRLRQECPGLQIAGTYSPPFRPVSEAEDAEIVRQINAARPDVIWVGLGLPKQERWIMAHRAQLNVPLFVGVGAAFKFASGSVRRAPAWMGERGLEWLWRLSQEPRRLWRRALVDVPLFTCLVLLELAGWRPGRRASWERLR